MPWGSALQRQRLGRLIMVERFQTVDKAQLARRFGAAARHYDAHARFQQEVGQALLEWMPDRLVGTDLTVSGLIWAAAPVFSCPNWRTVVTSWWGWISPPACWRRPPCVTAVLACSAAMRSSFLSPITRSTGFSPVWRCSGASVRPRLLASCCGWSNRAANLFLDPARRVALAVASRLAAA